MLNALYFAVRERWWNRDRGRQIGRMRRREQLARTFAIEWAVAMAMQLAEIRALPEISQPRR
jgi:hypothetical protein